MVSFNIQLAENTGAIHAAVTVDAGAIHTGSINSRSTSPDSSSAAIYARTFESSRTVSSKNRGIAGTGTGIDRIPRWHKRGTTGTRGIHVIDIIHGRHLCGLIRAT